MSALAEDLQPYFPMDMSYDVIIGHSLGGVVTLTLLPFIKTKDTTVILVDPSLEVSDEKIQILEAFFVREVTSTKTVEQCMAENPAWSRRDCMLRMMGLSMCDSGDIKDILRVIVQLLKLQELLTSFAHGAQNNKPWSFSGLLTNIPANVKITVLVADPKFSGLCRLEDLPDNVKSLNVRALKGIGHAIQFECPEAIMDAIPLPRGKL